MDIEHDVLVIGAGQAGLAIGFELHQAEVDFVILDGGERVGDCWRKYWDSLRLFSPRRFNHLPGMPCPGDPEGFPHKDEVGDYLEAYARQFNLPVQLGTWVRQARKEEGRFVVETNRGRFRARALVVATGSHSTPVVPPFAGDLDPRILQLTTTEYRNPAQLPEGEVLVVGAGNSGVQIAMEVCQTHPTTLAGPDTGRIPRRLFHRDVFTWIDRFGVMERDIDSRIGRRVVAWARRHSDPVVGVTRADIRKAGVTRGPRVIGHEQGLPQLADGSIHHPRTLIWCCGLRPDFSWIEGLSTNESGVPSHTRGHSHDMDSLFFMGLRFQSRIGSGLLGGVGRDASESCAALVAQLAEASGSQEGGRPGASVELDVGCAKIAGLGSKKRLARAVEMSTIGESSDDGRLGR